MRAGESLNKVLECLDLEHPERIKSTMLRKYLATTIQVMSLNRTEMEWVAEHLGHSVTIHAEFYRLMSSTIEKAKIAKLLILADSGRIDQFREKSLNELTLDEIPVYADVADSEVQDIDESECSTVQSNPPVLGDVNPRPRLSRCLNAKQPMEPRVLGDVNTRPLFSRCLNAKQPMEPRLHATGATKRKWNHEETEEIKQYFGSHITALKVPGKKECEEFIGFDRKYSKFTYTNIKDKVNSIVQNKKRNSSS